MLQAGLLLQNVSCYIQHHTVHVALYLVSNIYVARILLKKMFNTTFSSTQYNVEPTSEVDVPTAGSNNCYLLLSGWRPVCQ